MEVEEAISEEPDIQRLQISGGENDNRKDISKSGMLLDEQSSERLNFVVVGDNLTDIPLEGNSDDQGSQFIQPPASNRDLKPHVEDMLQRLAHSSAHFKHQQRNEPDLTPSQKYEIAREIFENKPHLFLARFKQHLAMKDIPCFQEYAGDYEIDFHLSEIQKWDSKNYKRKKVKNRRYKALMEMMSIGDEYFTEDAMKSRDPLLYEELIGQHLTEEERVEKANSIMAKNENSLSQFLLRHIEQQQENALYYSLKHKEEECFEEFDSDSDEEIEIPAKRKLSKPEKKELRAEFLHIMQERFLDGKDLGYDYSTIDDNAVYDDLDTEDKDEEEKYFDNEEPQMLDDTNCT
ncbi:coiled-coil domain-containing protein 97 [Octopus sinensis]|nr:coiled-coil domain-containing protein 97 [Octopus sinensis]